MPQKAHPRADILEESEETTANRNGCEASEARPKARDSGFRVKTGIRAGSEDPNLPDEDDVAGTDH